MSKRIGFVPAVSVGVLTTVMAFNAHYARSADDCIVEPNRQPPDGRHWYYHVDRATNHKCWYLGEAGMVAQRAPSDAQNSPGANPSAQSASTQSPAGPNPAGPVADRSGQREALALSRAQRDALFQEFIRWNELQRNFQ
jgi:hypothetical protein